MTKVWLQCTERFYIKCTNNTGGAILIGIPGVLLVICWMLAAVCLGLLQLLRYLSCLLTQGS